MIKGLPEKLQNLRGKYRYSQSQVARKLEVSPSIISAYESGERTPSTENLLALSYIYNCSTDYLLGKAVMAPEKGIDVSGLTEEQVFALLALVDSMKNK